MGWWARHFRDEDAIEVMLGVPLGADPRRRGSPAIARVGDPQSADLGGEPAVTTCSDELFTQRDP